MMYIGLPDPTTGACAAGDIPVYRVWDNRGDSNHRYTVDRQLRQQMVAEGWVAEGYGPDQVIMCSPDSTPPALVPPPCTGTNPRVAVPGAPHGMYVWNPNHRSAAYQSALANDVIGKNPTLCGASLVIYWSDVEPQKGVYDWTAVTTAAKPYTDAGAHGEPAVLRSDGRRRQQRHAGVGDRAGESRAAPARRRSPAPASRRCRCTSTRRTRPRGRRSSPRRSISSASTTRRSPRTSATCASPPAGGAEALPPPGYNDGGPCQAAWTVAGYSYVGWNAHEARIISAMGGQATDKQIMASLPYVSGGPDVYTVANIGRCGRRGACASASRSRTWA